MPTWLIPVIKNLFGGLFSFLTQQKAQADKERAEGVKAERESIRRAAAEERKIASAIDGGVNIHSPEDWNNTIEEWRY